MEIGEAPQRLEVNERPRTPAKLGAEVFSLGLELGDDGSVGAEPNVQILEGVVIDEVELNVLVAPAFAGGHVGCAPAD